MRILLIIALTGILPPLAGTIDGQAKQESARIAFYNVENFFDPFPDTTTHYNEFTPQGNRHWNKQRYQTKLQHIYKAIIALGQWRAPAIVGFAEIENRQVLIDLTQHTPLKAYHYKIIHYDSPDKRGIDVGLIYCPDYFRVLYSQAINVRPDENLNDKTRDILYVKGVLFADTIHLFVNHWPSRYGGLLETVSKRNQTARILRYHIDSVISYQPNALILVMGDMNENPEDSGIKILLQASENNGLIQLKPRTTFGLSSGSIKNKGHWATFDQFLVSNSFIKKRSGLMVVGKSFHIFDAAFLLEKDKKYMGLKPDRSFLGFKYHGGFSDHLPVFVDLINQNDRQP